MNRELLKKKVQTHWSWVLILLFFLLSIVNVYFGYLGLICITKPMYHAIKGRGKIHCSHYCPRGAIFGKFLGKVSLNNALPPFMRSKRFKDLLIVIMLSMFTFALIHSGGHPKKIAFAIARLMFVSFVVGGVLGIFYKPRAWCQICPMGTGTGYIRDMVEERVK